MVSSHEDFRNKKLPLQSCISLCPCNGSVSAARDFFLLHNCESLNTHMKGDTVCRHSYDEKACKNHSLFYCGHILRPLQESSSHICESCKSVFANVSVRPHLFWFVPTQEVFCVYLSPFHQLHVQDSKDKKNGAQTGKNVGGSVVN